MSGATDWCAFARGDLGDLRILQRILKLGAPIEDKGVLVPLISIRDRV
jgi:hypothetical protein